MALRRGILKQRAASDLRKKKSEHEIEPLDVRSRPRAYGLLL
jgi:hypothetical protein